MEQFVVRMIREKEDLEGKIKRLAKALSDTSTSRISSEEKPIMEDQLHHMKDYLECLEKRIEMHNE